jgi:hypothetical protein
LITAQIHPGTQKLIFGFTIVALTAIAGTAGMAAHQEKPTNGTPTSKQDCRNGGWEAFGFSNQGRCTSFVARQNHGHGYGNNNSVSVTNNVSQSARSGNATGNGAVSGNAEATANTSTTLNLSY